MEEEFNYEKILPFFKTWGKRFLWLVIPLSVLKFGSPFVSDWYSDAKIKSERERLCSPERDSFNAIKKFIDTSKIKSTLSIRDKKILDSLDKDLKNDTIDLIYFVEKGENKYLDRIRKQLTNKRRYCDNIHSQPLSLVNNDRRSIPPHHPIRQQESQCKPIESTRFLGTGNPIMPYKGVFPSDNVEAKVNYRISKSPSDECMEIKFILKIEDKTLNKPLYISPIQEKYKGANIKLSFDVPAAFNNHEYYLELGVEINGHFQSLKIDSIKPTPSTEGI